MSANLEPSSLPQAPAAYIEVVARRLTRIPHVLTKGNSTPIYIYTYTRTQPYTKGNIYKLCDRVTPIHMTNTTKIISWNRKHSPLFYFSASPAAFNQGSRSASTALGRPTGSGDKSRRTNSNTPSSLIASLKGPSMSPDFP